MTSARRLGRGFRRAGVLAALVALTACGDAGRDAAQRAPVTFAILSAEGQAAAEPLWRPLLDDMAQAVGVPPWKVKELVRQSRDWTPRGLATSLQLVAQADAAVKGASSDPAFALEQLVIAVAELRGRRPDSGMGR